MVAPGLLWLKAIFQTCFIVSLGLILFTFNHLIGAIALFAGYFSLPVSYTAKKPFKGAQAWLRLVVGGFAAFAMLMTFMLGGVSLLSGLASIGMFFVTWAFLMVLPVREDSLIVPYMGFGGPTGKMANAFHNLNLKSETYGKFIFLGLYGIGLILSISMLTGVPGWMGWMVGAFLLIGLLAGFFSSRTARPMMGMFIITLLLFTFSWANPETMGRVFFGYWWPQVESAGMVVYNPLMDAFRSLQGMWEDTTLLATCPQCYYQRQLIKQQAAATSEGTTSSLSFSDFRLIPSDNVDPAEDSAIYLQVSNTGEFAAMDVKVTLPSPMIVVKKSTARGNENVITEVLEPPGAPAGTVTVQSCSGGTVIKTAPVGCTWSGLNYPGIVRQAIFEVKWADELKKPNSLKGTEFYIYGGETVPLSPEIKFGYFVNVIYPMSVMNGEALDAALISKKVSLTEKTAKYSGGPLKASLWAPLQPLRSGEKTVITASLENTQDGDVDNVKYCIYVPKIVGNPQLPQSISGTTTIGEGTDNCPAEPDSWVVECNPGRIKAQSHCSEDNYNCNIRRCSFYVNYDIGGSTERTFNIKGVASYDYYINGGKTVTIAPTSAVQAAKETDLSGH